MVSQSENKSRAGSTVVKPGKPEGGRSTDPDAERKGRPGESDAKKAGGNGDDAIEDAALAGHEIADCGDA
jgi:hypothetical protein